MKLNKLTMFALGAALSMGFTACNDDDVTVVDYGTPVASTGSDFQGATNVNPRTTDITVNFNTEVKPANISKITVNDQVPDSVSGNGNVLLIYMPDGLQASTEYTVTLLPYSVQGANEDEHRFLEESVVVTFSTGKAFSKENVAKSLVNPNATAEARKLYSFLLENYGTKTLTGAMGGVAWESGYSDFIA
ncbi:MAG: Ig-like domain-containing protein, partial [Duncaniella sp.]|nr:Ig-like domain-containing protein [Duncaniella sp.]